MDRINPTRLDLAREFKARPLGPHGRELQKVLSIMRWMPDAGRPVVVCTKAEREWCVGELPEDRHQPVCIRREPAYASREEAFWEVFKLRWERLTGQPLTLE